MATYVHDERVRRLQPVHAGLDEIAAALAPTLRLLLRIGAGLLFMEHGAQKLFGFFGMHQVHLMSLMGAAGIIEFGGGLLLVLGLLTRPAALIMAAEMIAAYFMVHVDQGLAPITNKGELALLYALIWLYFVGAGGGPYSIDWAIKRKSL